MMLAKRWLGKGVILPTVMFVAMFALVMATALVARMSMNFDLSLGSVEKVELRYLSLGASNELLSDLNAGLDLDTYTKDTPRETRVGGRVVQSWVEKVGGVNGESIFAVARSYADLPANGQIVRQLAVFKPNLDGRVYANTMDTDPGTPAPIYYTDSGAWRKVPDLKAMRYSPSGVLEVDASRSAGTIPYYVGTRDDSVYTAYSPALDGWGDNPETIWFMGIPTPIQARGGDVMRRALAQSSDNGLTVCDLAAGGQIYHEITNPSNKPSLTKGGVLARYSHATEEWTPLPPVPEATFDGNQFVPQDGDYWPRGIPGPIAAYDGGVQLPLFRSGQDSIYQWKEGESDWDVLTPPGKDVMAMTSDRDGTLYVQTGDVRPSSFATMMKVVSGDFRDITPNTRVSALHQFENGNWTKIPDPPARFFNSQGQLVASAYPGQRGPLIRSLAGGKGGELYLVNRPQTGGLADTIYKYSDGAWELVPSPPNKHFDSSGQEVEEPGPPAKLEIALGIDGEMVVRNITEDGLSGIFVKDESGEYKLLPESGQLEGSIAQMSAGGKPESSGKGHYLVRATYF